MQEDDACSAADCAWQTDRISAAADTSRSSWTIAAGGTDCSSWCCSSRFCSSGNPQSDPQSMPDASSSFRADHARTWARQFCWSTDQPTRSDTKQALHCSQLCRIHHSRGASYHDQLFSYTYIWSSSAANSSTSSGTVSAGYPNRDHCYQVAMLV